MDNSKVSEIVPRLYQGAFPPRGGYLSRQGIRVLALCAAELQPHPNGTLSTSDFPGVQILVCPLHDTLDPLSPEDLHMAQKVAEQAAIAVRGGKKVLITCAMGINRSGLVTALTLRELTGMSGKQAVALIRRKRPIALTNPSFVHWLETLPARSIEVDDFKGRRRKAKDSLSP